MFLGKKLYVIAEVGSNWYTLDDCMKSIPAAKLSGADAVKFQLFTAKDLYGVDCQWAGKRWEMPEGWIPQLAQEAAYHGIDFMCTVFHPRKVALVDPYVMAHKVASSDIAYYALHEEIRKTRKAVIISTGGADKREIMVSQGHFDDVEVCYLYCQSQYPASNLNLYKIEALKRFSHVVGLSDHTTDIEYYPVAAVRNHGAVVIEKHCRLKSVHDTPDYGHSILFEGLAAMIENIKAKSPAKSAWLHWEPTEIDFMTHSKRRFIYDKENETYGFNRPLPAGSMLNLPNELQAP